MSNLIIGAGLLFLVMVVIHPLKHFTLKRRIETILITISGILLFSDIIAPLFSLEFDVIDNLVNGIYFIVFGAFVADIIYRKEKGV